MNSDRQDYLKRIDQLLLERESVANFVESGLRDIGDSSYLDLKRSINSLREVSHAEQLLASPNLIRLLPLLNSSMKRDHEAMCINSQVLLEEEASTASRLGRTFGYPSIMFMAIFAVFLFQAFYLSPTFEKMFAEFELRLPSLTKAVLALNQFTRAFALIIIPGILLIHFAGGLIRYWISLLLAQLQKLYGFDFLLAGRVPNLVAMSRFMRVLADLYEIGTPIPNAVRYAGSASQHALYRFRADQLAASIQSDSSNQTPWESFPPQLGFALRRDVNSDRSVRLLREFASTYGNQASLTSIRHSGMTSPWLILLLGAMIFLLVLALFAPLVSLVTSLSGGY